MPIENVAISHIKDREAMKMQRNTVVKFGGTSVQTANAINQVIEIIINEPSIRVAVFSAVGGMTNLLVKFYQSSFEQRCSIVDKIRQTHLDIVKDLDLSSRLDGKIFELLSILNAFCSIELDTEKCDEILAIGEKLSSLMIYHALKQKNVLVEWVDAKEIVITNDFFGKATPQVDLIRARCQQMRENITEDTIIVTQGFIGATQSGQTTTLGRGGSDYSAALIAEAIEAENVYIYTDVKGVYTMDPRIVRNAKQIREMSFQEMAELANFGAKVIHPATLAPCMRANIPVTILSTFEPTQEGTRIIPDQEIVIKNLPKFRAIAIRKKQILVTIRSLNMLNACGFLANVFSILAHHKITVDLITTSEVSVALTIDGNNLGSHEINPFANQSVLEELQLFADIVMQEDLTLITLVGSGLMERGVSQSIFSHVMNHGIRLICYGASASNMGFLVATEEADIVAKRLHNAFIETNSEHNVLHLNEEYTR